MVIPFALWDHPGNFWRSTVGVLLNPVLYDNRGDTLSMNAAWFQLTGHWASTGFIVAAVVIPAAAIIATRPRDLSDVFALGAALTTVVILANREAYLNYYFVAAVALFLAVAYEGASNSVAEVRLPRPVERIVERVVRAPLGSGVRLKLERDLARCAPWMGRHRRNVP